MNKKIIFGLLVGIVVVGGLFILGTLKHSSVESKANGLEDKIVKAEKVEVFLFHATRRCPTCVAIGKLASETVDEYFKSELQAGKIEFREINIDLLENKTLAEKFQASGSALFINAIYADQDNISEDLQVWQLTQDKAQFKAYLKNKLDNLIKE
ncbi:MAG: nitrophenyl compound nitroreductase subunit ArsF family protein [Patescibacteria group bacterium]